MPKYKYSGGKTKAHPKGDSRVEKPRLVKRLSAFGGGYVWAQGREHCFGGVWSSVAPKYYGSYKTKAEALKHRPKW